MPKEATLISQGFLPSLQHHPGSVHCGTDS
jgi:hypothetical protein